MKIDEFYKNRDFLLAKFSSVKLVNDLGNFSYDDYLILMIRFACFLNHCSTKILCSKHTNLLLVFRKKRKVGK